jgi:hypothetical protein
MKQSNRLLRLLGALLLIAATVALSPGRAEAQSPFKIKNLAYQQCMGAPDRSLNVVLRLLPCNSGPGYRLWYRDPGPVARIFYLRNAGSVFCAEVNQDTAVPGELVDNWYCDQTNSYTGEQWEIYKSYKIGEKTYLQFRHIGTNPSLCLDTVGSEGSQLMQWYCDENLNAAQLWEIL